MSARRKCRPFLELFQRARGSTLRCTSARLKAECRLTVYGRSQNPPSRKIGQFEPRYNCCELRMYRSPCCGERGCRQSQLVETRCLACCCGQPYPGSRPDILQLPDPNSVAELLPDRAPRIDLGAAFLAFHIPTADYGLARPDTDFLWQDIGRRDTDFSWRDIARPDTDRALECSCLDMQAREASRPDRNAHRHRGFPEFDRWDTGSR